jgi:hypothetical protein
MTEPSRARLRVQLEMWLSSADTPALRLIAQRKGVTESETKPRQQLLSELMVLGMAADTLLTPKRDRRL